MRVGRRALCGRDDRRAPSTQRSGKKPTEFLPPQLAFPLGLRSVYSIPGIGAKLSKIAANFDYNVVYVNVQCPICYLDSSLRVSATPRCALTRA